MSAPGSVHQDRQSSALIGFPESAALKSPPPPESPPESTRAHCGSTVQAPSHRHAAQPITEASWVELSPRKSHAGASPSTSGMPAWFPSSIRPSTVPLPLPCCGPKPSVQVGSRVLDCDQRVVAIRSSRTWQYTRGPYGLACPNWLFTHTISPVFSHICDITNGTDAPRLPGRTSTGPGSWRAGSRSGWHRTAGRRGRRPVPAHCPGRRSPSPGRTPPPR